MQSYNPNVDLELKPLVSPLLFNLRDRTPLILPRKVFIYICQERNFKMLYSCRVYTFPCLSFLSPGHAYMFL